MLLKDCSLGKTQEMYGLVHVSSANIIYTLSLFIYLSILRDTPIQENVSAGE